VTAAPVRIEPMTANDWTDVRRIYLEGIATGNATFETEAPVWEVWDAAHHPGCRLVARGSEGLLGWAALSPVSGRCVYGGVADVSIYVAERARGLGIGRLLLQALIDASERDGLWTLQAGIFPENRASLALHRATGFRDVGLRERIACHGGVWRDVLLLERRSDKVGV
jgi:L-amino acid N-acyltransferase YncA